MKQNAILKKLDELKQTLMSMRGDTKVSQKANPEVKASPQLKIKKKQIDAANLTDVVINVHPKNIPYSLLALKNQWQSRLKLSGQVFTHSSVHESEVTGAAKEFAEKLMQDDGRQYATLNVTLIWKNVTTTEMISTPSKLPVFGEINIIRYLNRIGPNEFYYENDNHEANMHDQILDISYQLSKKQDEKERQKFVKQLGQRLGNSQFFNGSPSLSISDIAVSSILKKFYANNNKALPANLASWLGKVSSVAGY
jgi:aminoacyl tRNA synthase complex-interacting multifunctional protein 2